MLGQRVAAELLHRVAFGELHNPQQIAFQMSPAELRLAGVILQVGAETVAAQDTWNTAPSRRVKTALPRVAATV